MQYSLLVQSRFRDFRNEAERDPDGPGIGFITESMQAARLIEIEFVDTSVADFKSHLRIANIQDQAARLDYSTFFVCDYQAPGIWVFTGIDESRIASFLEEQTRAAADWRSEKVRPPV